MSEEVCAGGRFDIFLDSAEYYFPTNHFLTKKTYFLSETIVLLV